MPGATTLRLLGSTIYVSKKWRELRRLAACSIRSSPTRIPQHKDQDVSSSYTSSTLEVLVFCLVPYLAAGDLGRPGAIRAQEIRRGNRFRSLPRPQAAQGTQAHGSLDSALDP